MNDDVTYSIFKYGQNNFSLYIKKCICFCMQRNGELIDIPKLIEHLGFNVSFVPMQDKALIEHHANEPFASLYINESLEVKEQNTVAVFIVAEYLLRYQQGKHKRIIYDMFYLDNIKLTRMSKHTFLATRLAIPEAVIEKLDEFNSDKQGYSELANLPLFFLELAKKQNSVEAFLKMTEGNSSDWLVGW